MATATARVPNRASVLLGLDTKRPCHTHDLLSTDLRRLAQDPYSSQAHSQWMVRPGLDVGPAPSSRSPPGHRTGRGTLTCSDAVQDRVSSFGGNLARRDAHDPNQSVRDADVLDLPLPAVHDEWAAVAN